MPLKRHQQNDENIYFQDRHPCRLRRHQQKYENIYFQDRHPCRLGGTSRSMKIFLFWIDIHAAKAAPSEG